MDRKIAVATLIIILALVNWAIVGKERHLARGRVVYLELAPVDPRSLMQGDYMALHFRLSDKVYQALPKAEKRKRWRHDVDASDGYVVVRLDEQNIARFKRIHDDTPLSYDEMLLQYRVRNGAVKFATNAFFFQEGHGEIYEPARYGQFRVNDKGEVLLVDMYDTHLNKLQPDE